MFEDHLSFNYVKEYAEGVASKAYKPAEGLFNAEHIVKSYESAIWDYLEEIGVAKNIVTDEYRISDIRWDYYDESIELDGCEDGFTMTTEQVQAIKDLGFKIIFVNYKNFSGKFPDGTTPSRFAMPVIKDVDK